MPNEKAKRIIKVSRNNFTVLFKDGTQKVVKSSKKLVYQKEKIVCGDLVILDEENQYIKEIMPRKNEIARPKLCNIDQALIIISANEPKLDLLLLDKLLINLEEINLSIIIIFTKSDLIEKKDLDTTRKIYDDLGYKTYATNEQESLGEIKQQLEGNLNILIGQSGVGKSTLLNNLFGSVFQKTNTVSKALLRGRHTTVQSEIFIENDIYLVDTPGFSSYEVNSNITKIQKHYPEFRDNGCHFSDCSHVTEPKCTVKEKLASGGINAGRYENYLKIIKAKG